MTIVEINKLTEKIIGAAIKVHKVLDRKCWKVLIANAWRMS